MALVSSPFLRTQTLSDQSIADRHILLHRKPANIPDAPSPFHFSHLTIHQAIFTGCDRQTNPVLLSYDGILCSARGGKIIDEVRLPHLYWHKYTIADLK
jgi:hypothetical protein